MTSSTRGFETHSPEFSFVRLPLRDDRIAQLVGGVLLLVLIFLIYSGAVSLWMSLAIALLCLVATWKLFVPVKIDLGPRGIIQSSALGTRKTPWREISRYTVHQSGIVLYLTDDDSPLAGFASIDLAARGMSDNLEPVVRYYMESRRLRTGSSIVQMVDPASESKV